MQRLFFVIWSYVGLLLVVVSVLFAVTTECSKDGFGDESKGGAQHEKDKWGSENWEHEHEEHYEHINSCYSMNARDMEKCLFEEWKRDMPKEPKKK